MRELEVVDAMKLRTHDLRRGCTQDLVDSGASLVEILRAGEWRLHVLLHDVVHVHCSLIVDQVVGIHCLPGPRWSGRRCYDGGL